ncbi:hypothetical protein INT47_003006 [Mucor saturninus]|uniref:Uncharacterized protein n=1 Tax=Mucor saturninus TaxID=64648 RepID=A0A8H7UZZ1_9FUNG|nr:hypothetical protein INT47_003006 [Mucor saturninus]
MNFASATNITDRVIMPRENIISSLLAATYSFVGDEYLDSLVKEIGLATGAQTIMIQRLLTSKEYHDLKENEGCPAIRLVSNEQVQNSRETSPIINDTENHSKVEYLLVKACYSTILNFEAFKKYAAISLNSFSPDSPFLQTLGYSNYHVAQDASFADSAYPKYASFVGLRLDQGSLPIGLITVMNDKPMKQDQIETIQNLLFAVQQRATNEIEKIRQRDNLVMIKNAALQDAESKIKFLADMSHEIRTPMNAVIALTDLLLQERSTLNEEQAEHLEVIQTSGNHLLTVINDILDISKINHDPKFKLENRRFSLRKCVKDALNMARHQASMTQYNKLVCVAECPAEVNDNIPLNQLVKQLEIIDPNHQAIVPQQNTSKTVLPLLWKIDSDVPDHLMGDTMRLTQILLNLCSNAVKFTKSGGIRVKITRYVPPNPQKSCSDTKFQSFKDRFDAKIEGIYTRVMGRKRNGGAGATNIDNNEEDGGTTTEEEDVSEKVILEISVTDTGIGMPADRLPRLFKSFSQIDISTARRYGGTGLGLAISSMLVNRMGGGLWVESEEGLGSRFALTLPLSIAHGRPDVHTVGSQIGSENSSTYASSGMVASPPSPGSSVSDGGSSIGERSDSASFTTPSSPSTSTSYFPTQPTNTNSRSLKYPTTNTNTTLPWEPINIPSTPSPTPATFEPTYISSNANTPNVINNKELQNLITKSKSSNDKLDSDFTAAAAFDLPTTKPKPRITLAKQYHHRKSNANSNEENLALLYPIKIMLAEDNVLNQKIAISILKRLGYQDVIIAGNGREALDLMRVHKFDVIFMDLYMPEMDGLEATRYIISERKHNVPPPPPTAAIEESKKKAALLNVNDVYIIALTASASKQDRQICIDAGMNDFISKPFTMMEMKSALKNCASKRKKRKKQQLRDEQVQKQQQAQELINLVKYNDDPMVGIQTDQEDEDEERDPKCRSRSSSIGSANNNNRSPPHDDPMHTSVDDLAMIQHDTLK